MANVLAMAKIGLTNPRLAVGTVLGSLDVSTIVGDAQKAEQTAALSGFEKKLDEVGGGLYRIEFKFGVFALILGLAFGFLMLFFANAATRQQQKSDIVWKVLAGVGFFAAAAGVVLLANIGVNLFTAGE